MLEFLDTGLNCEIPICRRVAFIWSLGHIALSFRNWLWIKELGDVTECNDINVHPKCVANSAEHLRHQSPIDKTSGIVSH